MEAEAEGIVSDDNILETEKSVKNIKAAGTSARQLFIITTDKIEDVNGVKAKTYYNVTGLQSKGELYTITCVATGEKAYEVAKPQYDAILKSLALEKEPAKESFKKDFGSYNNVQFQIKDWVYRSEKKSQKVVYHTMDGRRINCLPVEGNTLTDEAIKETIKTLSDEIPNVLSVSEIIDRTPVNTSIGQGEKVNIKIYETIIAMTFVLNEKGQPLFAFYIDPKDSKVYDALISSLAYM